MTRDKHRSSVPDRARRRAVRAHAARLGVPYSVAARLLRGQSPRDQEDDHRAWMSAERERRRFAVRVRDTRLAADLPLGRAKHLVERFPPTRVILPLKDGDHRATLLGLLYLLLAAETPAALPDPDELAWVAELGEEDAVDLACAVPDRAARRLLDGDTWQLWTRVEAALAQAVAGEDRRMRDAARTLDREFRTTVLRHLVDAARQTLDAVLAPIPPGTRVRLDGGVEATVVGARWTATGPPTGYEIRPDAAPAIVVEPDRVVPSVTAAGS